MSVIAFGMTESFPSSVLIFSLVPIVHVSLSRSCFAVRQLADVHSVKVVFKQWFHSFILKFFAIPKSIVKNAMLITPFNVHCVSVLIYYHAFVDFLLDKWTHFFATFIGVSDISKTLEFCLCDALSEIYLSWYESIELFSTSVWVLDAYATRRTSCLWRKGFGAVFHSKRNADAKGIKFVL